MRDLTACLRRSQEPITKPFGVSAESGIWPRLSAGRGSPLSMALYGWAGFALQTNPPKFERFHLFVPPSRYDSPQLHQSRPPRTLSQTVQASDQT
jgi:hypothetical protein